MVSLESQVARRYWMRLALGVLVGPAVFSFYVFTLWSFAAELGFAASFPWTAGPLSNSILWFALALILTLALLLSGRDQAAGSKGDSSYVRSLNSGGSIPVLERAQRCAKAGDQR
jgi:hypothetical protein